MTEQEKKQRIAELRAELKELEATPRSDWHAGFEALLRIETHKYGDKVHISTEEEIGEVPPRTDFVILVEDEKVEWEKAIFRIFRKINIPRQMESTVAILSVLHRMSSQFQFIR